MKHELKTVQPYFEKCWENQKAFEVRINDRDFQTGDTVLLQEYNAENQRYTAREILAEITYVLVDFPGIEKGYCVFGFTILKWLYADRQVKVQEGGVEG